MKVKKSSGGVVINMVEVRWVMIISKEFGMHFCAF